MRMSVHVRGRVQARVDLAREGRGGGPVADLWIHDTNKLQALL